MKVWIKPELSKIVINGGGPRGSEGSRNNGPRGNDFPPPPPASS